MNASLRVTLLAALCLCSIAGRGATAELRDPVPSSPCAAAPTIDGMIGEDEWAAAEAIEFDVPMAAFNPPGAAAARTCQLRVMNSANGLYVALRVPDETRNESLAPFDLDLAVLVFSRGQELAAGDDRKVIAPGVYLDKHVTTPGQDADDARQDGRGRTMHADGAYALEWAVPLASGDANDLQAAPGDVLRFNLAYFDAFVPDLKGTQVGVAFGSDLNRASTWGTLQLAADVADDGGAAFADPQWVEPLFATFDTVPANRLRLVDAEFLSGAEGDIAKCQVEYTYLDPRGRETTGRAKLYLPAAVQEPGTKLPLYYSAGYELDDAGALRHVARGCAVVTPAGLEANPLVRTVNPDYALLHIARALPFVEDARVVAGGGSAGGYVTLMLAAETFPLAGAAPDVPPINWGYNAAFFWQFRARSDAPAEAHARVPVFAAIVPIVEQARAVYGEDFNQPIWHRHSPVAHAATITCPVSVYWSTADMLVPIDQVGTEWIRPFDAAAFPAGFTMDPADLTKTAEGRLRLLDVLSEGDFDVFVTAEADIRAAAGQTLELPISRTKQWSIAILDEGPPEPQVGHMKYAVGWTRNGFYDQVSTGEVPAEQLTAAKLERLMDRYAGREWLPSELTHLDFPESERADVLRGLRTYVAASADNVRRFSELYGNLPDERRVLSPNVVEELIGTARQR